MYRVKENKWKKKNYKRCQVMMTIGVVDTFHSFLKDEWLLEKKSPLNKI
jgi:hypothetical protein